MIALNITTTNIVKHKHHSSIHENMKCIKKWTINVKRHLTQTRYKFDLERSTYTFQRLYLCDDQLSVLSFLTMKYLED